MDGASAAQCNGLQQALARLRHDLAAPTVFVGVPRGAVGAIDTAGNALYGYPEIAGYWLRWASGRGDVADRIGDAVLRWLGAVGNARDGWPPRTPVDQTCHIDPEYRDCRYLFDHAMLLDGLLRWGQRRGAGDALRLAAQVHDYSTRFAVHGRLQAVLGRAPTRWSGTLGPFLLKVCSRLQHHDGPLAEACRVARASLADAALCEPHAQLHPQLYAIEGLFELGELACAGVALDALLRASGGVSGARESLDGGPRRADVLAQLLRAGARLGRARAGQPEWEGLALELAQRVDASGRMAFAATGDPAPTWAALFAEQALATWLCEPLAAEELV